MATEAFAELADVIRFSVGDGESAASVAARMPRLWFNNVEVVPLIGGVGQLDVASHPIEVARAMAARVGGRVRPLPAPAVVPDAATAAQIIEAPAVADAFAAMKRCAVAVVGVGPGLAKAPALHAAFAGAIVTACGRDAATAWRILEL